MQQAIKALIFMQPTTLPFYVPAEGYCSNLSCEEKSSTPCYCHYYRCYYFQDYLPDIVHYRAQARMRRHVNNTRFRFCCNNAPCTCQR